MICGKTNKSIYYSYTQSLHISSITQTTRLEKGSLQLDSTQKSNSFIQEQEHEQSQRSPGSRTG